MKQIILFILSLVTLVGCHTGKTAAEHAAEKRAKFVSDSIKYEAVKDAFMRREFVFKVDRQWGTKVNPQDYWMLFSGEEAMYQGHSNPRISPQAAMGTISDYKYTYNEKKKTITLTGSVRFLMYYFSITLFEGSDKAYGYFWQPDHTVEGWIEPLGDANIVRGWMRPQYDFRK